jgi:hypothetical protein
MSEPGVVDDLFLMLTVLDVRPEAIDGEELQRVLRDARDEIVLLRSLVHKLAGCGEWTLDSSDGKPTKITFSTMDCGGEVGITAAEFDAFRRSGS